jgi:hypothetical protein
MHWNRGSRRRAAHRRRLHPAGADQRVQRPGRRRDYSGDYRPALSKGDLLTALNAGQHLGCFLVEHSDGYFTHTVKRTTYLFYVMRLGHVPSPHSNSSGFPWLVQATLGLRFIAATAGPGAGPVWGRSYSCGCSSYAATRTGPHADKLRQPQRPQLGSHLRSQQRHHSLKQIAQRQVLAFIHAKHVDIHQNGSRPTAVTDEHTGAAKSYARMCNFLPIPGASAVFLNSRAVGGELAAVIDQTKRERVARLVALSAINADDDFSRPTVAVSRRPQ